MSRLIEQEAIELVDSVGVLVFQQWYKNELTYTNGKYLVTIKPEYRDTCLREETLQRLMVFDDYYQISVFIKADTRPLEEVFSCGGGHG